jgi:hypothetical protein
MPPKKHHVHQESISIKEDGREDVYPAIEFHFVNPQELDYTMAPFDISTLAILLSLNLSAISKNEIN